MKVKIVQKINEKKGSHIYINADAVVFESSDEITVATTDDGEIVVFQEDKTK